MFTFYDNQITSSEPFEYVPVTGAETYEVGEALKMSGGKATKCGATDKPVYICMGKGDGNRVPVVPVLATRRYEVPYTAKPTVGTKVTLHTDGLQVTATTASGVFEITSINEAEGTATGYFK